MAKRNRDDEAGSAVVDFVLVSLILVPLSVAILQLGFALDVRNTLAACAQDGARYAADANIVVQGNGAMADAAATRATSCVTDTLPGSFAWHFREFADDHRIGGDPGDGRRGTDCQPIPARWSVRVWVPRAARQRATRCRSSHETPDRGSSTRWQRCCGVGGARGVPDGAARLHRDRRVPGARFGVRGDRGNPRSGPRVRRGVNLA